MNKAEHREEIQIRQAKSGDQDAMMQLLDSYRALLNYLSCRLTSEYDIRKELIQAGYVGLLHAIRNYEYTHKTKLSTYAVPWILGEMKKTLRNLLNSRIHECSSEGFAQYGFPFEIKNEELRIDYIDLRSAIRKLRTDEQMLICLRYFRGKTQCESAALLKKSQAQISRMESSALCQMRSWLQSP